MAIVITPAVRRLRQEDYRKLEANLVYKQANKNHSRAQEKNNQHMTETRSFI